MAWYDNALMEIDMRLNGGTEHHVAESVMGSRRRLCLCGFENIRYSFLGKHQGGEE